MVDIEFKTKEFAEFTVVFFKLVKNVIVPSVLKEIEPPNVPKNKGVILSGRGPVWLFSFLTHAYHPTRFIGIYDPRMKGAVIVETHWPGYEVGDVVEVAADEI